MIPVPGFEDLRVRWIKIRGLGFVLYGFLLYSNADRQVIEFMEFGLPLLDMWSGPETAIFVIESPNKDWLRYVADQPDHPWHLFESASMPAELATVDENTSLLIQESDNLVLVTKADQMPLSSLLKPNYAVPYGPLEVERVRKYFGLELDQYPCVIFFEDLYGRSFFHNPMPRFPDVQDVRYWFQCLFVSPAFKDLLEKVRLKVKSHA
jgi:hypothetical protein